MLFDQQPLWKILVSGLAFVTCSALVFWPLEEIFDSQSSRRPKIADLATMWFYQSFGLWIGAGIIFEFAFLIRSQIPSVWLHWVASFPFLLQTVLALLFAEIWVYTFHRLSHRNDFLWQFHKIHHSVEEMTWSAASRHHPVDFFLTIVGANLPAMILGIDLRSIGLFLVLERFYTVLLHSNLRWDWGWLTRFVASPSLHRSHHQPEGHHANFAGLLSMLDVMGKTYSPPINEDPSATPQDSC